MGAIIIAVLGLLGSFANFRQGIVVGVLSCIGGLVANLCLLHGAIKYNRTTTLIYLIMDAIFMIFLLVGLILIIVGLASSEVSPCLKSDSFENGIEWKGDNVTCSVIVGILVALLVGYLIGLAISIYFWVCVYSFFDDLKKQQLP